MNSVEQAVAAPRGRIGLTMYRCVGCGDEVASANTVWRTPAEFIHKTSELKPFCGRRCWREYIYGEWIRLHRRAGWYLHWSSLPDCLRKEEMEAKR